jgi:hypothetical protein
MKYRVLIDLQRTKNFKTIFVKNKNKNKKQRGGRLKVKIHILFYGDNPWTVEPNKWSLVKYMIIEIPTSVIWTIICLTKLLSMAMVRNFEVMLWQALNHSVYNC